VSQPTVVGARTELATVAEELKTQSEDWKGPGFHCAPPSRAVEHAACRSWSEACAFVCGETIPKAVVAKTLARCGAAPAVPLRCSDNHYRATRRKCPTEIAHATEGFDWLGIEDGLRNFLRSEECLETSQLVASLA